ncbi:hypothetical protein [Paenibacillus sp.]|uniref:hypothetical protein n=1 Tax=Paenibacillus sp. TaxID=58172 RepID=UPI0028128427|nr:hypothetical protein [Paenibacillus sp.]
MQALIERLFSLDRDVASEAFHELIRLSEEPVEWAYDAWDRLAHDLTHKDNRRRSHASQLLSNLAKSDPEGRITTVFPELLEVTKDERFVTARHCLLSLWKIALVGPERKRMVVEGLAGRFRECAGEKNGTLIRHDIVESLGKLYDADPDEAVKSLALELIELEADPKYRKKYASVWKKK